MRESIKRMKKTIKEKFQLEEKTRCELLNTTKVLREKDGESPLPAAFRPLLILPLPEILSEQSVSIQNEPSETSSSTKGKYKIHLN